MRALCGPVIAFSIPGNVPVLPGHFKRFTGQFYGLFCNAIKWFFRCIAWMVSRPLFSWKRHGGRFPLEPKSTLAKILLIPSGPLLFFIDKNGKIEWKEVKWNEVCLCKAVCLQ